MPSREGKACMAPFDHNFIRSVRPPTDYLGIGWGDEAQCFQADICSGSAHGVASGSPHSPHQQLRKWRSVHGGTRRCFCKTVLSSWTDCKATAVAQRGTCAGTEAQKTRILSIGQYEGTVSPG
ncbi:hypothetical protein NLU13_3421 [Sarocladium strictum]|uniref:Uncharacterized protein n=1 Tax=Sarocladium strictum TaxID=5046 RepID=A0AA39GNE8_SARSR|nr:hypothetical protein NLU13_3421 [Sarocladium strictum]